MINGVHQIAFAMLVASLLLSLFFSFDLELDQVSVLVGLLYMSCSVVVVPHQFYFCLPKLL